MTLLSLQVLIESLSAGFWWYATLNPYWYSVPCTAEVKRNFGAGVCQRAHEPWSIKVRSTCAKLSTRQVCLWARESQAQLAFWSRAHRLFFCLTASGCLYLSIWPCSSQMAEEGGGIYGGRGRFFQRAWQLLLSSRMPGHCSISLFWEVHSPSCSFAGLAGLPSDGRVDPGGMEEEHGGRETGREGDRAVLPDPGLSSDIHNKRLTTQQIYWNPLPSLTSQFCWKPAVNKQNH